MGHMNKHHSTPPFSDTSTAPLFVRSVVKLHVDDVISKPQVRQYFSGIDELANSLLVEGQQSPIIVYPANSEGKYLIQKGERRWRACLKAGIKYVEAIINEAPANSLEETAGELIENIQRENLTAMEIASALNRFVDAGWSQVDIAARIGKSTKFVSTHLGLLKLQPPVANLFEKRMVIDADTLNILRQIYELDIERCLELCRIGLQHGLHRQLCRSVLRTLKNKGAQSSRPGNGVGLTTVHNHLRKSHAQYSSGATSDTPWLSVPHDSVCVMTEVEIGGSTRQARLLTNRISFERNMMWVEILESNGEKSIVSAYASHIRLISISDADDQGH
jgi:ParB family chromosome partitioning protein